MSPSVAFSNSVLGRDYCNFAKDRSPKIDDNVVSHGKQDKRLKIVCSATPSVAGETNHNEFQRRSHGVNLSVASCADPIVMNAKVFHKNMLPILYPYGYQCIPIDEVPESLEDVSEYGFHVWDLQVMKVIGNKATGINQSTHLQKTERKQKAIAERSGRSSISL